MKFSFLILLFALLFEGETHAQEVPAHWKYVTLRSAHFDLMVNAEQQELGVYYLGKFERAYSILRTIFTHAPERVTVVIADSTDQTNGYATRIPYPQIVLFPVLPNALESLGESGDWVLELCAHELTHVFTFEAVTGPFESLQSIFGTIMSPNLMMPRWWKEGVAVEVETLIGNGGRLRSAYQDGVLRTLEKDGQLAKFTLPEINELLPDWPEGLRPYMFGSLMWSAAVAKKGVGVIDQLHNSHGGRFPFFLSTPAETYLGVKYQNFYDGMIADLRYMLQMQILQLETTASTASTELRPDYKYIWSAEISPDGQKMAAIVMDLTDKRRVLIFERNASTGLFELENSRKGSPDGYITRLAWLPDGKRLVFDKVDTYTSRESYSDLWIFDLEERKSKQLTHGLRAREPIAKADGTGVYFVGLGAAKTWIGFYDLEKKVDTHLHEFGIQERAAWPALLPTGDLVFSLRTGEGRESLLKMSPDGAQLTPVLTGYPNARFPRMTSAGLMFTSSQNGIHNVYRADASLTTASPLTHVLGNVLSFEYDKDTGALYPTMLTSKGARVHRVAREEIARISQAGQLPAVPPLLYDRFTQTLPVPPDAPQSGADVKFEREDYSPYQYLRPRYWIPLVGVSSINNSLAVSASTSGYDPLKRHVYSLAGEWDFGTNQPSYLATYQNNSLSTSVTLIGQRMTSYYITTENTLTTDMGMIALTPDLFRFSKNFAATLAYSSSRRWDRTSSDEKQGPMLSLLYADYGRDGQQISPESGGSVYVSGADYLPGGNRISFKQYMLGTNFYFSKWLPPRHAIAFRTAGIYTPEKGISNLNGAQSTNFMARPDDALPVFLIRGYRLGQFFGNKMANGSLEYRFPIREIRRGHGTDPFFITRIHGALYADAIATEGAAYHIKNERFYRVGTDRIFHSFGGEGRLETDLGYGIPVNVIVGYAMPSHQDWSDGWGVTLALQIGAIF